MNTGKWFGFGKNGVQSEKQHKGSKDNRPTSIAQRLRPVHPHSCISMQLYLAYEQLAAWQQDAALQQKKVMYKPPPVGAAWVADHCFIIW